MLTTKTYNLFFKQISNQSYAIPSVKLTNGMDLNREVAELALVLTVLDKYVYLPLFHIISFNKTFYFFSIMQGSLSNFCNWDFISDNMEDADVEIDDVNNEKLPYTVKLKWLTTATNLINLIFID